MSNWKIHHGDCLEVLKSMPDASVHCCVTSPPYFGLRDYGHPDQIGLEATPDAYVAKMVEVFREVRRVLRDDGTLWLNLGDSYAGSCGAQIRGSYTPGTLRGASDRETMLSARQIHAAPKTVNTGSLKNTPGLKRKDLIGIPWRVAFALQADGWYLRQDIIWHKPNPMPESVTDRCTKAHEHIFLMSKNERYYFDREAMKEAAATGHNGSQFHTGKTGQHQLGRSSKQPRFGGKKYGDSDDPKHATKSGNEYLPNGTRNRRSVWTVSTSPFEGAHFATFPPRLIEPCILAGCPDGGVVLDPFNGAGTTGVVAVKHGRRYVGVELNAEYVAMSWRRLDAVAGQNLFLAANAEAKR